MKVLVFVARLLPVAIDTARLCRVFRFEEGGLRRQGAAGPSFQQGGAPQMGIVAGQAMNFQIKALALFPEITLCQ